MSESYPVTLAVRQPDGSIAHVRVGTAVRSGDGFRLSLGDLSIGAVPDAPGAPARRSAPSSPPPDAGGGQVFPPYGRSKGMPVAGASVQDLEFYASGCRRTLNDPAKSRWHDKERVLLAAIEAELTRQNGGGGGVGVPGGGGGGASRSFDYGDPPGFEDGPPPRSDDDIPF